MGNERYRTPPHENMEHDKPGTDTRGPALDGSLLQAILRGWAAGTLGLPGNLEELGRKGLIAAGADVDKYPVLPPAAFFNDWLPGKQQGDESASKLGELFGGAGAGSMLKYGAKALTPHYAEGGEVEPSGPWWDRAPATPEYTPLTDEQKQKTIEAFKAQVAAHPEWVGADGKFKGPTSGANYQLEGSRPEDFITQTLGTYNEPNVDRDQTYNRQQMADAAFRGDAALAHPAWIAGPDNGGGVLGGIARGAGTLATGISKSPMMYAITAGLAPMINPAISEGLQGVGLSEATANAAAPYVASGGKTLLSGGDLGDVAKNAVGSYVGAEVSGEVKDLTNNPFAASAANTVTQAVLNGKFNDQTLAGLAAQYASGELTDLTGLPSGIAKQVVALARGKTTPVGALTSYALSRKK